MLMTYTFLLPLLLGFALAGASAFTAAYSRRWGERGGQWVTSLLRNALGIPLWMLAFILAWLAPAPLVFTSPVPIKALGGLLLMAGSVPIVWGHLLLGWRSHMPSVRDTLVRHGLYAYMRHPIYGGMFLAFAGLALLRPTVAVMLACALGIVWLLVQARLEELDLVQRLPVYRQYMHEVPRFIPCLRTREPWRP